MSKSRLSDRTRRWIKQRKKEDQRLEFKKRIDLSTPATKAEFIRDVIALANSGGEYPREEGYLVVGVKDGKCFDISRELYDGATFGQIMHSYISPCPDTSYEEFANGKRRRFGVLVIRPDPKVLYVVQKRLQDDQGKPALLPGQSWGRRSAGKYELLGGEIQERIRAIMEREIDEASSQTQRENCEAGK
jgi:Putative DNA-binding domain